MHIITLTTDFGTRDWFAGTMKGVILGINPRATVVDITHEIRPGDIRAGAFALAASYGVFPKGTVHLAVVDPGVGSGRNTIAVRTQNYFFVGPDNGVLSFALAREKIITVRQLANAAFFRQPVSRTFHGRDVFAPVAAQLSRGAPIGKLGRPVKDYLRFDWPQPRALPNAIGGEVVYVDRFGNAITNLDAECLRRLGRRHCEVFAGRKRLCSVGPFYQSVPAGWAVAVVGSSGFLEIAVNGGSAAKKLGFRVGTTLTVQPKAAHRSARRRGGRA